MWVADSWTRHRPDDGPTWRATTGRGRSAAGSRAGSAQGRRGSDRGPAPRGRRRGGQGRRGAATPPWSAYAPRRPGLGSETVRTRPGWPSRPSEACDGGLTRNLVAPGGTVPTPPQARTPHDRRRPAAERHGTPRSQFTLWLAANLQITAIVDGALAVVFGPTRGGPSSACSSATSPAHGDGAALAQGHRLGLPQMISSRAQFGVFGAAVPLVLVIVMYLGFTATGTVLSGQAINALLGVGHPCRRHPRVRRPGGRDRGLRHELIHAVGRVASLVGRGRAGLPRRPPVRAARRRCRARRPAVRPRRVLLAISLGAGWQLTYGRTSRTTRATCPPTRLTARCSGRPWAAPSWARSSR